MITDAQRRVLELLDEAGDRGLTPRELADKLWPPDPERPETTNRPFRHDGRSGGIRATYPMKAGRMLWALMPMVTQLRGDSRWRIAGEGRAALRGDR